VKRRSIGFRLAAWYSLVFGCGLAIFGVSAWFGMRASVYHAIDDELRDRVRGIAQFMTNPASPSSLAEMRNEMREHSVLGPGGDLLQVCDQRGDWLYRSPSLAGANVAIPLPATLGSPRFDNLPIERHELRLYSERIVIGGQPYTVQVAALMNEAFEALDRFRLILLFAIPLMLFLASAGGYWLSTRALAPVDEISRAAQRIGIENLSERLRVPQTGDQLQRLSETLNVMFSRLQASVQRMKQFTADASHELRAPVSLIRTTAEVAVQRDRPAAEYREALDEILQESERTSQLVDSLMLLARGDSLQETLENVPADMCAIVREAAGQGEKLARSHGLEFSAQVPSGPLEIHGDSAAIRRALLILIDNAAKYTPAGGRVQMGLTTQGSFAVAAVTDSGIGIAPGDLAHIFDRFWRADKARSREQGGAGLGLSIAKWIAETHGGSVEVESEPGKGSSFRMRLPLNGASPRTEKA
jgi:two-component system, OmpR family, heavy metal sensor histidine kinase CusS